MSFLDDIRKQPKHVREIMFGLSVVITISLVGVIWFRSFEEDLFVMMNPEPKKQAKFYAERNSRTPVVYANLAKAVGNLRATLYNSFGFFEDYSSKNEAEGEEAEGYEGEVHKLPLSGDK